MKLNLSQTPPYPETIGCKPFFLFISVFYFFFLLLTPLGNEISFLPPTEPRGIYHLLHIDKGDDAGHFTYLRSLFFDHDIDFFNEPYYIHHRTVLDTGYVINHWKIGPAILWFPFFLLAHVSPICLYPVSHRRRGAPDPDGVRRAPVRQRASRS